MGRKEKFNRSKKGLVGMIYDSQVLHSKLRGHRKPDYTKDELRDWCFSQEDFHTQYNEWVMSKYERWTKPSVDRKDDNIHYCFTNIQLMSWQDNNDKNVYKNVRQLNKDGSFVADFNSVREASDITEISMKSISRSIKGTRRTGGGFIWQGSKNVESI